jgi:hypothetical protein
MNLRLISKCVFRQKLETILERTACPGKQSFRVESNYVISVQRAEGDGSFSANRRNCYTSNNWTWQQRRILWAQKVFASERMRAFSTDKEIATFICTVFEGKCDDVV